MVAFAKTSSPSRGALLEQQGSTEFILTKRIAVLTALGVLAFWSAVALLLGGALYSHQRSLAVVARNGSATHLAEQSPNGKGDDTAVLTAAMEVPAQSVLDESGDASPSFQMVSPTESKGPAKAAVLEDLRGTHGEMTAAANASISQLGNLLDNYVNAANNRTLFVDTMLGAESKLLCVVDPPRHRRWCEEKFRELILDSDELTGAIRHLLSELNSELLRLRSEQLVRLQLDEELSDAVAALQSDGGVDVEAILNGAASEAAERAAADVPEFVVRQAASWIAGYFAKQATLALLGDSEDAQWFAWGVEMATEMGTDDALFKQSNPDGKLHTLVQNQLIDLRAKLTDSEDSNSAWRQIESLLRAHQQAQLDLLRDRLPAGVELDSAE